MNVIKILVPHYKSDRENSAMSGELKEDLQHVGWTLLVNLAEHMEKGFAGWTSINMIGGSH